MTENYEAINEMFGGVFGQTFKKEQQTSTREYRCVKCKYPMELLEVNTAPYDLPRKLFFCKKNTCTNFGTITVVAAK